MILLMLQTISTTNAPDNCHDDAASHKHSKNTPGDGHNDAASNQKFISTLFKWMAQMMPMHSFKNIMS